MKLSRTLLILLVLSSVSTLALSCASRQSSAATSENEIVTVQRGDLNVDISAVGNLALSDKEDLAFEIPGTVEEVPVKEGDSVVKGQVLARLDTPEWDKQLTTLERQVTTAERQVTSAEKQFRDKKTAVVTAENQVTSKEFALRQAQLDLQTAQDALTQITDVKKVQEKIDNAEYTMKFAKSVLAGQAGGGTTGIDFFYWTQLKTIAETELAAAKKEMQDILTGNSLTVSSNVALDVAKKQLAVDQKQLGIKQAQLDLDNARLAVEDARNVVAPAQQDVRNAQDDLKTTQKNLDDAKSYSPEVKAPFDGFITKVSVEGGDEVKKGTVAVQVADPTRFKAEVLVSEMDISKVKLGGVALVELQSMTGKNFSANITHIAPTATIQQGVVNYKVTVELQSLQPVVKAQKQSSTRPVTGNTSAGTPLGRAGQFSGSANLTQEQVAEMMRQRRPDLTQEQINQMMLQRQRAAGGNRPTQEQANQMMSQRQMTPAGQTGGQVQIRSGQAGQQAQASAVSTASVRLAEGMTVSVSLPVDSRSNVVLVPNGAIITRAGQSSVKVVTSPGATEDRVIQSGISNWQYTEVTGGLSEGEQVVITRTTANRATSTSTQQRNPVRMPVMGFGPR